MITIITQPAELCFRNRIGEIEVSADAEVVMTFSVDNGQTFTQLYRGSYIPNARGKVRFDVTDIVKSALSTSLPTVDNYTQQQWAKMFRCTLTDGSTTRSIEFTVANAEVNTTDDASEWLASHFLTNQPQQYVTDDTPLFISLYEEAGTASLKGRFYTTTGRIIDITIVQTLTSGCHTCNINYKRLLNIIGTLTDQLSPEFDIILQRGRAEAATRRYIHTAATGREKYFMFVNKLGGIDTLTCTGENVLQPETEYETGTTANRKIQIQNSDKKTKWMQNSGWMPYRWRNWIHEIMTEQSGAWHFQNNTFTEIIMVNCNIAISDNSHLQTMSFEYTTTEI